MLVFWLSWTIVALSLIIVSLSSMLIAQREAIKQANSLLDSLPYYGDYEHDAIEDEERERFNREIDEENRFNRQLDCDP